MTRLIDADAFLGRVLPECRYPELLREQVEAEPTVDPVKHGHWIQRFTGDENIVFCSSCSEEANEILDYKLLYEYDFCPYCGAKMDIKEEL